MSDVLTEKNTGSLAKTSLSDKAVSYIRTIFPIIWGSLVVWLLANVPALADFPLDLNNPGVVGFATSVAIALWYVIWRAVEPHIPNWLTGLVLGSSKQPAYVGTAGDPIVAYVEPIVEDHAPDEDETPAIVQEN